MGVVRRASTEPCNTRFESSDRLVSFTASVADSASIVWNLRKIASLAAIAPTMFDSIVADVSIPAERRFDRNCDISASSFTMSPMENKAAMVRCESRIKVNVRTATRAKINHNG